VGGGCPFAGLLDPGYTSIVMQQALQYPHRYHLPTRRYSGARAMCALMCAAPVIAGALADQVLPRFFSNS
jgi:hypothetical protein